ncbi:MAG: PEGA domain-containing protein [Lachnospiraceae bacterium]|nr:PEGA domain-containing protein [Lachnospiraceae bacterium]
MSGKMCRRYIGLLVGVLLLTAGCGSKKTTGSVNGGRNQLGKKAVESSTESSDKKFTMPYNISIKAVIMKLDTQAGIVQLKNTAGGLGYTLTYTNQTQVWDKYGGSKMMEEVAEGDLVEAYIDDSNGRLSGLIYSNENWEFQGSQNWSFNTEKSELMIGKEKYYYTDDMVILSEGSEASVMDLNKSDILNIQGCGKKVLSVTVEQGHGYIKLLGISDFVGGWVEIGKVIKPISEDMLIAVPEGNWSVTVVKDGYGGAIGTTVERNKEVAVDFSEIASRIVRYGTVEFTIEPEDAILYIAGREMDYGSQIMLEYDNYKIRVSADGYEDYTGDLKVDKALVSKKITLEKTQASADPTAPAASASPSPTPSPSPTVNRATPEPLPSQNANKTLSPYVIKVNSPERVNVYFDDEFVGVSPVNFIKVSGNHTITLSKDGYVTKSYSVEIGTEEKDVTFDLPDLQHVR